MRYDKVVYIYCILGRRDSRYRIRNYKLIHKILEMKLYSLLLLCLVPKMGNTLPEDDMCAKIATYDDLGDINIKKSAEFLMSNRGDNIHVRSFWPEVPTAVVIYLHGYLSHVNRPTQSYVSEQMLRNDWAYITLDFFGHGYSDGLQGLIKSDDDAIDDMIKLLISLYSDKNETEQYKLTRNADKSLPFFLFGHSMGGTNSIHVSNLLSDPSINVSQTDYTRAHQQEISELGSRFQGTVILCPALEVEKPHPAAVFLMSYVVPLIPETPIVLIPRSNDSDIWMNDTYRKYIQYDRYPENPNGLSFSGTMRFQTAQSLLKLTERAKESLPLITYPFLVFHDPEDKVTMAAGSEILVTEAKSEDKTYIKVEGGRHDLLANRLGYITGTTIEWIRDHLAKGRRKVLDHSQGQVRDVVEECKETDILVCSDVTSNMSSADVDNVTPLLLPENRSENVSFAIAGMSEL